MWAFPVASALLPCRHIRYARAFEERSYARYTMRSILALAGLALTPGCQRTPEQQQADAVRSEANKRAAAIENEADVQAGRMEQQASDLHNQAIQAGGMTGERLGIRAKALDKESKVVRKQADTQADAIKEEADARIKASKSR